MRIAIPHWNGRISPVLDVAGVLLLADINEGTAIRRQSVAIRDDSPLIRARRIAELDVDMIICGAISRELEIALSSAGIEIIGQTCGDVEEVLEAYLAGMLQHKQFLMPGCCGRQRRFRGGRNTGGRGRMPHK